MNDEGEKIFVNRRGRKQTVDNTEPITDSEVRSDTKKPKCIVKKPRKKSAKKQLKRWQKISIAILVLLLASPILLGESLRLVYGNSSRTAIRELEELVDSKVMPIQQNDNLTAQQLQSIADNLKIIRDKTCAGGLVDNAAALYPRAKSAHGECLQERRQLANLTSPMQDMSAQLAYLKKLKPIVEAVTVSSEDQYAVISSQHENWKNTAGRLKDLKPPTSFLEVHASLTTQSSKISDLWTKLSQAYEARDSIAFQTTEQDLGKAYEDFRAHTSKFQTIVTSTQAKIISAYSQSK